MYIRLYSDKIKKLEKQIVFIGKSLKITIDSHTRLIPSMGRMIEKLRIASLLQYHHRDCFENLQ